MDESRKPFCRFMWVPAVLGLLIGAAHGAVRDIPAEADTFILASAQDNNAGGHLDVAVGRDSVGSVRRGLFRFDLSTIPPGTVITSAVLRLSMSRTPTAGSAVSHFALHRLTAEWGEGTRTGDGGATALTGDATWGMRRKGVAPWLAAGGDFVAGASASVPVNAVQVYEWRGSGVMDDVRRWVDNPSLNFGWLLKTESEGTARTIRWFGAREQGVAPAPPVLRIGYLPADAAFFTSIRADGNSIELQWRSARERRYDVLYRRQTGGTSAWAVAESDIPASGEGTNIWTLSFGAASPADPRNSRLYYGLSVIEAPTSAIPVTLDVVVSNLVAPVALTHAGDGSGRLFIAEQTGVIRVVDANGVLLPAPFLDLSAKFASLKATGEGNIWTPGLNPLYDERGLLGLAFDPFYAQNGRFYVHYSLPKLSATVDHESIVAEYRVSTTNVNAANPASERISMRVDQAQNNHNGGALAFGPDGLLYVGLGDGGGTGDAHGTIGNGQNRLTLPGSILRIDVAGNRLSTTSSGMRADDLLADVGEVFAFGFRNPWRLSFDRGGAHDLFVGDVGSAREEIDVVRHDGNYGWRIMEGSQPFDPALAVTLGLELDELEYPIHEYAHGVLGTAVIGGFVYRGNGYPLLQGKYVFGDFSASASEPDGVLYYLHETRAGTWLRFEFDLTGGRLRRYIRGFGEDEQGELYVLSSLNRGPSGVSGDVRRLRRP